MTSATRKCATVGTDPVENRRLADVQAFQEVGDGAHDFPLAGPRLPGALPPETLLLPEAEAQVKQQTRDDAPGRQRRRAVVSVAVGGVALRAFAIAVAVANLAH